MTKHKDVTERLQQLNPALAYSARKVLDVNKSERHIRGGLATREKYLHKGIESTCHTEKISTCERCKKHLGRKCRAGI